MNNGGPIVGRRWQPSHLPRTAAWRFGLFVLLFILASVWALGVLHLVVRQLGETTGEKDDQETSEAMIMDGLEGPGTTKSAESLANSKPNVDERKEEQYVFEYWKRGRVNPLPDLDSMLPSKPVRSNGELERFITFEDDAGGWNNIRMAFEAFVMAAKLTNRTLVLPPRVRFYLLDYGPIQLFKRPEKSFSRGYEEYYDFEVLAKGLRFISTDEFLARYPFKPSDLTEEVLSTAKVVKDLEVARNGFHTKWFLFLRQHPDTAIWPSGFAYPTSSYQDRAFSLETMEMIRSVRLDKRIIHFPVHLSQGLRYLEGVPALLDTAPRAIVQYSMEFIRRFLPYSERIQREAKRAIMKLGGPSTYSCIHVRRNELQYKSSFLSAQASLKHVRKVFNQREHVYIATDETEPGFFKAFTDEGFRVSRLEDALGTPAQTKYDGMVEQLICAFARSFVGTSTSTFSSYINRLRLYVWAQKDDRLERWLSSKRGSSPSSLPDLRCFFHDLRDQLDEMSDRTHLKRTSGCGSIGFNYRDAMFALKD